MLEHLGRKRQHKRSSSLAIQRLFGKHDVSVSGLVLSSRGGATISSRQMGQKLELSCVMLPMTGGFCESDISICMGASRL